VSRGRATSFHQWSADEHGSEEPEGEGATRREPLGHDGAGLEPRRFPPPPVNDDCHHVKRAFPDPESGVGQASMTARRVITS
jgi:hypothetical protein